MLLLCLPIFMLAETVEQDTLQAPVVLSDQGATPEQEIEEVVKSKPKKPYRHEVRITAGDCMFENLVWHNQVRGDYSGCGASSTVFYEKQRYHYTPHFDVQYHYLVNNWLSVGLDMDFQYTEWKTIGYGNKNVQVSFEKGYFYNLCIMPSVRFTYAQHPLFRMYSSVAAGLDINGGTEQDLTGKNTAVGGALDLRVLGFAIGPENCMFTMDFGGLTALKNKQTMFMVCSKIIQIGVACRF